MGLPGQLDYVRFSLASFAADFDPTKWWIDPTSFAYVDFEECLGTVAEIGSFSASMSAGIIRAIKTMYLGEEARITVEGHGDCMVRLSSWDPVKDIFENGQVMIRTLSIDSNPGVDESGTPDELAKVCFSGIGFAAGDTSRRVLVRYGSELKPFECALGDGTLTEALDVCLSKMQMGERANIRAMSAYVYGQDGAKTFPGNSVIENIGPDQDLEFEITLHSFEVLPKFLKMAEPEKVAKLEAIKESGNALFKLKRYRMALAKYDYITDANVDEKGLDEASSAQYDSVLLSANLNSAVCFKVMKQYRHMHNACLAALALDARSVKAHFKKAQAERCLGLYKEAAKSLKMVVALNDSFPGLKSETTLLRKLKVESKQSKTAAFKGWAK